MTRLLADKLTAVQRFLTSLLYSMEKLVSFLADKQVDQFLL